MKLLIFAHRAEAQVFLERKDFIPIPFAFSGLYNSKSSNEELLLVSGEGRQRASERLAAVCGAFRNGGLHGPPIHRVVNLGVAGALALEKAEDMMALEKIYPIRTCYGEGEFKSFSTTCVQEGRWDCISAQDRVFDKEKAYHLSHFAPLVDRECWAIGSVCALFKLPFSCFKLASDRAGAPTPCQWVQKNAMRFSEMLYDFYQNISFPSNSDSDSNSDSELDSLSENDFYFTTSQGRRYQALMDKLKIKWRASEEEVLLRMDLEKIHQDKGIPKKKTALLLKQLEGGLHP